MRIAGEALALLRSVPVMFLTARAAEVDRVVGLEIGADDYVVKPFSPREVAARVRAILKRSGARAGAAVAHVVPHEAPHEFSVDAGRAQIHFLGQPLKLTPLEFRLLEKLLSQPLQVFAREPLQTHRGFGYSYQPGPAD